MCKFLYSTTFANGTLVAHYQRPNGTQFYIEVSPEPIGNLCITAFNHEDSAKPLPSVAQDFAYDENGTESRIHHALVYLG